MKRNSFKFGKAFQRFFKKKESMKVGLALGSGGIWGATHIGLLKVLEENNIQPDYIAGSSAGAIIGACYALNPHVDELEKKFSSLTKWEIMKLMDLAIPKISFIHGKKIRNFFKELIEDKSFSDTKIPLQIIATDINSGEEIVIKKGKLIDAIMASISIPAIFPPIKLNNRLLVDGGLINPTPINKVKEMGSDVVIGMDLTIKNGIELKNLNIFQTLTRSYDILRNQSTKFNIPTKDENILIIKPDISKLRSNKFHEIQKFIDEGERITRQELSKIKILLENKNI